MALMLNLEHKGLNRSVSTDVDESGVFEAIVAVTELEDEVNDVIHAGAFEKSLRKRTPKGIFGHDWKIPIARTIEIKELRPGDPLLRRVAPDIARAGGGGLYVKAQYILGTQAGREAYEVHKAFGDDTAWSIGYKVMPGGAKQRGGTRHIYEMEVHEYSQVLWGAAPLAKSVSLKSLQPSEAKRDYSSDQRSKLASKGHALPDGSFPIVDEEDLRNAISLVHMASDPARAKTHVIKRARELDAVDALPSDWHAKSLIAAADELKDLFTNAAPTSTNLGFGESVRVGDNPHAFDDNGDGVCSICRLGPAEAVHVDEKTLEEKAQGGADRNRGNAEVLRRYWLRGAGAQKIRWGTDGDWRRCVALLTKHLGPRARGYCSLRHKEATGLWTGDAAHRRGVNSVKEHPDAVEVIVPSGIERDEYLTLIAEETARESNGDYALPGTLEEPVMDDIAEKVLERLETDGWIFDGDAAELIRGSVKMLLSTLDGAEIDVPVPDDVEVKDARRRVAYDAESDAFVDEAIERRNATPDEALRGVTKALADVLEVKHDAPWTPEYHPGKHDDPRWKKPKGDNRRALSRAETAQRRKARKLRGEDGGGDDALRRKARRLRTGDDFKRSEDPPRREEPAQRVTAGSGPDDDRIVDPNGDEYEAYDGDFGTDDDVRMQLEALANGETEVDSELWEELNDEIERRGLEVDPDVWDRADRRMSAFDDGDDDVFDDDDDDVTTYSDTELADALRDPDASGWSDEALEAARAEQDRRRAREASEAQLRDVLGDRTDDVSVEAARAELVRRGYANDESDPRVRSIEEMRAELDESLASGDAERAEALTRELAQRGRAPTTENGRLARLGGDDPDPGYMHDIQREALGSDFSTRDGRAKFRSWVHDRFGDAQLREIRALAREQGAPKNHLGRSKAEALDALASAIMSRQPRPRSSESDAPRQVRRKPTWKSLDADLAEFRQLRDELA